MKFGRWVFSVVRKGSTLFPDSERSERIIREFPYNKPVLMEARSTRNPKHHNLYWAILDRVIAATQRYPNSDNLNDAIKIRLGHVIEFVDLDGEVHLKPDSIAVSAMKQEEFNVFFQETMMVIGEYFYADMSAEQIADIEELIAGELGKRAAHGGRVPD